MSCAAERAGVWRAVFLAELKRCGNVTEAATRAGVTRQAAYKVRGEDKAFAADWDDAVEQAVDDLEQEAWRRARHGCKKYVTNKAGVIFVYENQRTGEIVGDLDMLRDWIAFQTGQDKSGVDIHIADWKLVPLQQKEYSDTLMCRLLSAHRPGKYRENLHLSSDPNAKPEPFQLVLTAPPPGAVLLPFGNKGEGATKE
jgi:hypothetical protein